MAGIPGTYIAATFDLPAILEKKAAKAFCQWLKTTPVWTIELERYKNKLGTKGQLYQLYYRVYHIFKDFKGSRYNIQPITLDYMFDCFLAKQR